MLGSLFSTGNRSGNYVFSIVSGQQWSSLPQRWSYIRLWWHRSHLFVAGICCQKQNKKDITALILFEGTLCCRPDPSPALAAQCVDCHVGCECCSSYLCLQRAAWPHHCWQASQLPVRCSTQGRRTASAAMSNPASWSLHTKGRKEREREEERRVGEGRGEERRGEDTKGVLLTWRMHFFIRQA